MKKDIHPKLYRNAKVTDLSSGQSFTIASTKEEIVTEVTNLSHPFYTGKHRIVDTENLVKKFEKRRQSANSDQVTSKKAKLEKRRQRTTSISSEGKLTLKDMLSKVK
jgi:large subunit ribosomal protein L31